jgi:hypothetical protein
MKLDKNIISHIVESAEKLKYGEIVIKITEGKSIDVHVLEKFRFDKKEEKK